MRLFLFSLPLALTISYALIAMMAWMVDLNVKQDKPNDTPLSFDIFVTENEEQSQRINRTLPTPPTPKPQPPKAIETQPSVQQTVTPVAATPLPEIKLDLAVQGIKIAAPVIPKSNKVAAVAPKVLPIAKVADASENQMAIPQYRIKPKYPNKALKRRIEGFVILTFDIGLTGRHENIKIKEAKPPRIFNRDAIRALRNWKYQPLIENGEARIYPNQQIKLEFKIK